MNMIKRIWEYDYNKWLIIVIILWIVIIIFTLINKNIYGNNYNRQYLLSATAQVLAAIGAILFSFTIIIAQLSSRYSQRITKLIFKWQTTCYILLFVFCIILALYGIPLNNDVIMKIILFMNALCLLLLLPYLLWLKEELKPERILLSLKHDTESYIKKKNSDGLKQNIISIDNMIMSAYSLSDYDTIQVGIDNLFNIVEESNDFPDIQSDIFNRLTDICIKCIEDPKIPYWIMKDNESGMCKIAKGQTNNETEFEYRENIINKYFKIAIWSLEKKVDYVGVEAIYRIKNLIENLIDVNIKKKYYDKLFSALLGYRTNLHKIGIKAINNYMNNLLDSIGGSQISLLDKLFLCDEISEVQNPLRIIITSVIASIIDLGEKSIENKMFQSTNIIISNSVSIIRKINDKKLDKEAKILFIGLWHIGAIGFKNNAFDVCYKIIDEIKAFQLVKYFDKYYQDASKKYPNQEQSLNGFQTMIKDMVK